MKCNVYYFFKILLLVAAVGGGWKVRAQVNEGGTPPSFAYEARGAQQLPLLQANTTSASHFSVPVKLDLNALKAEDAEREANGAPPRMAEIIPVHINIDSAGEWTTLPNGRRIWRLTIEAKGAQGLMLTYDKFAIPAGGRLYLYNAEQTEVLGAYTSNTNVKGEAFATELLSGESLTLEYVEPATSGSQFVPKGELRPSLVVSGVAYAYNHLELSQAANGAAHARIVWAAQSCEVNVNCPEGAEWQNQKKGVARILIMDGSSYYLCSGTVVNNTAGNLDPLFLSAFHCFEGTSAQDLNRTLFYFNFESPGCASPVGYDPDPQGTYTITGATMLVQSPLDGGSDGVLLRLNQAIPASYNVFYNGWERRDIAPTKGVGIHHPNGAIKKISTYSAPASSATARMSSGETGLLNAHWRVDFVQTQNGHGVTEGGSSGSPLFDQNKRVVGTLTGGTDDCSNTDGFSIYGKLSAHYDQAAEAERRMGKFLDPLNTGADYVDGTYFVSSDTAIAAFLPSASEVYVSGSVHFDDASVLATTWEWTFEGGTPASYVGRTPPAITYDAAGDFIARLLINKSTVNERTYSLTIKVRHKQELCSGYSVSGSGTQTSPFPLGALQYLTFSAARYTLEELGLPRNGEGGIISKVAWNAKSAMSQLCMRWIYLKEVDDSTFTTATTWDAEQDSLLENFTTSTSVSTAAGWNSYMLSQPFAYTGSKNIEVLVVSSAPYTSAGAFTSSECYYTPKPNAHQQWVSATGIVPTTPGIIGSNRPDIRIEAEYACGYSAPVASFAIDGAGQVFGENFDGETFPPLGWTVRQDGASTEGWMAYAMGHGDSNDRSAIVLYDDVSEVNTWLISPYTLVPENAKVEWSAYYGRQWFTDDMLSFYLAVSDSPTTWVKLWGNREVSSYAWRTFSFDLSAYAGKNIRFAWQYRGLDGDVVALDEVKLYVPMQEHQIMAGDAVHLTDYSSGPPVSWEWTLAGSEEKGSTVSNPTATYLSAGVFDILLKVKNGLGTSEKKGRVTVNVKKSLPPQAAFLSDSYGYRTHPNSGQYLAPQHGGEVYYGDVSTNEPSTWRWTLPGIDSASQTLNATRSIIQVSYPKGENIYDARLDVGNSAGKDSIAKSGEVKVGGGAKDVWNVYSNEEALTLYGEQGYPYFAPGVFFTAISERFEASAACIVSQVKVFTALWGRGTANVVVSLYTDNGGFPGSIITTSDPVPAVSGGYTTVSFNQPVGVPPSYHVVLSRSGPDDVQNNFYCVPSTASRSFYYNTTCIKYGQYGWLEAPTLLSYYISLNVVPTLQFTNLTVTSDSIIKKQSVDLTPSTISFTSNANTWMASSSDSWLHLSGSGGTVNAAGNAITVSCDDNVFGMRTGVVTLSVGGTETSIMVVQAGKAPAELVASYNDQLRAAELKWVHELPTYLPGDDIFEDMEALPNFATASSKDWAYPWTFFDGDGQYTYAAGTGAYANATASKSFIVFAVDGEGVSLTETQRPHYLPHNGNRCFISFASSSGAAFPTNDFLISPLLSFKKDATLTLWAKSGSTLTTGSGARIRIAYSTTGTAESDFTFNLSSGGNAGELVPMHWEKIEVVVPAAARYVAIISQTEGGSNYALLVDDIYIGVGASPRSGATTADSATQLQRVVEDSVPAILVEPKPLNFVHNRLLSPLRQQRLLQSGLLNNPIAPRATTDVNDTLISPRAASDSKLKVLRWDDGAEVMNGSIGLSNGQDAGFGIRFEPTDLALYKNAIIRYVDVLPASVNEQLQLVIYEDKKVVHSQSLPAAQVMVGEVNRINLNRDVVINSAKELAILYYVRSASYDKGPAIAGKGDVIDLGGGSWGSAASLGFNYNFIMAAYVEPGQVAVAYNIYRGGNRIDTLIGALSYADSLATQGFDTCYHITAVYDGDINIESAQSNSTCVFIKAQLRLTVDSASRMEAEPNPKFTAHADGNFLNSDTEATILPHVTFTSSANITSPAGTYTVSPVVLESNALHNRYTFVSVPDSLRVLATPTRIIRQPANSDLCVDDPSPAVGLSVAASGLDVVYHWQRLSERDSSWSEVRQTFSSGTETVGELLLNPISVADAGTYRVLVKGRSTEQMSDTVTLRINLPQDNLLVQQWSDVLTVNNRFATNGGYSFVRFQWYRNGEPIEGATRQYLQLPKGGDNATYTCQLKTSREEPLGVCPFVWTGGEVQQAIAVFPNPAKEGEAIRVQLRSEAEAGSVVNIYGLGGELLRGGIPMQGASADISLGGLPQGVYLLQVAQPTGERRVIKIVVTSK
jgi:hypothetical protein